MQRLGLIAGNRKFPFIICEAAKKRDYYIVAIAIKGDTAAGLRKAVDKIYWLNLRDFGKMFEIFKKENVSQIVMAGQISPHRLFSKELRQSKELRDIFNNLKDKRADTIFGQIADRLKQAGFELLNSTAFIEDFMPKKGTLTNNKPSNETMQDVNFGFYLAKAIADLDIGQTVGVKDKAVVAIEALEGTDNLIRRAGRIAHEGLTIVKVSKPKQDLRFDVPVVGLNTIKNLIKIKAKCLAIEAGKTLFIDREKSIELAERKNLCIIAV